MNREIIEGNWKQFKGKLKARWGRFTDEHRELKSNWERGREGQDGPG